MEGTGIPGHRAPARSSKLLARLSRLAAAATLSASGVVVMDVSNLAPGSGPFDPPLVEGEPLDAALEEIAAWAADWWPDPDRQPGIDVVPDPGDIDRAFVFVVHQDLVQFDDVAPPEIRLDIGVEVPDLRGLTLDAAREESGARTLELFPDQQDAGGDWTVVGQGPGPGDLVGLGTGIEVAVRAAPPPPTREPPAAQGSDSAATPTATSVSTPVPGANPSPAADPIDGGVMVLVAGILAALVVTIGLARLASRSRPGRSEARDRQAWAARIRVELNRGSPPEAGIEEPDR